MGHMTYTGHIYIAADYVAVVLVGPVLHLEGIFSQLHFYNVDQPQHRTGLRPVRHIYHMSHMCPV